MTLLGAIYRMRIEFLSTKHLLLKTWCNRILKRLLLWRASLYIFEWGTISYGFFDAQCIQKFAMWKCKSIVLEKQCYYSKFAPGTSTTNQLWFVCLLRQLLAFSFSWDSLIPVSRSCFGQRREWEKTRWCKMAVPLKFFIFFYPK